MTEENLWARGRHRRHAELYDAEYAKQLERIARIRSEVSANLPAEDLWAGFEEDESPAAPSAPPSPPPLRPAERWDAAPTDLRPARATRRIATPAPPATPERRPVPQPAPVAAATEPDERPAPDHPVVVSLKRRESHPVLVAVDHPESRSTKPVEHPEFRSHAATGRAEERRSAERPWLRPPVPPARRSLAAAPRRGDAAPGRDTAKPRRRPPGIRTRWIVVAGALAAIVGFGAAMFAARPATAPAATVFQVPSQPTGLVALDGRVWVAGPMSGAVWVLDGESGQAVAPPLLTGGTPARLALDSRDAWIADTERGALVRVPRVGKGVPQPVRTGPDIADVAVAGGAVWAASSADGTIRVLDPNGRRRVLRVGARPVALDADGDHVVAADAAGSLIRMSARTRRADGPAVPLGGAPVDVALTGDRAWVADAGAGTVRPVTLSSGRAGAPIRVGRSPVAVAADARGVYVVCRGDRTLVRLDPNSGAVRSKLPLDHVPTALALDPRHVWIAAGDHEVIRVDR